MIEVWANSETTWGAAQADKYVRGLVAAVERIRDEPRRWRSLRDKALPGIFYFRHEHNFVFFRWLSKGQIGLITVQRESMNLPARLREDLTTD